MTNRSKLYLPEGVKVEWLFQYVSRTGIITITHNLHDQFDLRPTAGRTGAYNIACQVLGTMYHDVLGGNDKITIEAKWQIKK